MHVLPNFCRGASGPRRLGQGLHLFFTAHLQCPVLFLGTHSFPTDTRAQFPNSHFNKMAPKVLLGISPQKLEFSSTCSKKDGWTWHTPHAPLNVLKGQLQAPWEASSCRHKMTHNSAGGGKEGFRNWIPLAPFRAGRLARPGAHPSCLHYIFDLTTPPRRRCLEGEMSKTIDPMIHSQPCRSLIKQ